MYIFSFNRFAWFDRVFKLKTLENKELNKLLVRWNLLKYQDDIFLCLWDEVSFKEQYEYKYEINNQDISLISKSFLTNETLDMVNWMVYWRYSNYKSVLKYFISFDIEWLISRWKIQDTKSKKKIINNEMLVQDWKFQISDKKIDGQQLLIFPDLWTLFNTLDESILSLKWNIFLKSNDTQNQKDKKRWMIKNWEINNVFCTHSELFQDWKSLKKIILIDPYKRYYENQQDPRYNVKTVVEKMSKIYWAELYLW